MCLNLRNDAVCDALQCICADRGHRFQRPVVDRLQRLIGQLGDQAHGENRQSEYAGQRPESKNGDKQGSQQQIRNCAHQIEQETNWIVDPAGSCQIAGAQQGDGNGSECPKRRPYKSHANRLQHGVSNVVEVAPFRWKHLS
ncbi:hypothetical protein D3C77_328050 [compost metagenome]